MRSSPKQAELTWSGYFPGTSLLPAILVLFLHIIWVRHWLPPFNEEWMSQEPPPLKSLRAHRPWPQQAALHFKLRLHLFPFLLCWTFPLLAPHGQAFTHQVPHWPKHTKWDCSLNCVSNNQLGKRAHAKATEADVSSGCSTPQGDGEAPEKPLGAPKNDMVVSGSTEEHDREDNADHCGDESTQDKSRENAANFDLESHLFRHWWGGH